MNEILIHNSAETLCIYAFYKLQSTGDLRYLIKNVDYSNLPEISEENKIKLNESYSNLIFSQSKCDLTITYLYAESLKSYSDFVLFNKNENRVNITFQQYLDYLDTNFVNFEYNDKIYKTASELYKFKKSTFTENLYYERLLFFDFKKFKAESKNKFNLYESIAFIKTALGIDINEFECSVEKFNIFIDLSKQKMEKQKAESLKNKK